jgi:hypothetical protein
MARIHRLKESPRLRLAAALVADRTFDYRRTGFDHRPLTFLGNGLIGRGAAGREASWRLRELRGRIVLEINSKVGTTCRLKKGADDVWRGRWIVCERMPVQLTPIQGAKGAGIAKRHTRSPKTPLPPSLFVVSLPRSLSSHVYQLACRAVGLNQPTWTSDGEILNLDRFTLYEGPTDDQCRKFVSEVREPGLFRSAEEFLSQTVNPFGYGYKDVAQPFVASQWLRDSGMRAIRIKRNIADVAYSMLDCNWHYPAVLFPEAKDPVMALVLGLLQAERALDSIKAEHIDFEELIVDERLLHKALQGLYGNKGVERIRFIDNSFNQMRSRVLKRRGTRKHRALSDLILKVREKDEL